MKAYRIETYILSSFFLATLASLFVFPNLAIYYFSFTVLVFSISKILKENTYVRIPLFIFLTTVFISYFLRPFVLYDNLELFAYGYEFKLINNSVIDTALFEAVINTLIVVAGFLTVCFVLKVKNRTNYHLSSIYKNNKNLIISLLLLLGGLKLFLHLGLKIGLKGNNSSSPLAFLLRFIPRDLPFILISIYFLKYHKHINRLYKFILIIVGLLFCFAVLATGSKTFILNFGVCIGVYYLYIKQKAKLSYALLAGVFGFILVAISFIMSSAVKVSFATSMSTTEILLLAFEMAKDMSFLEIIGAITERFNGLDGQIAVNEMIERNESYRLGKLMSTFDIKEIFTKSIEFTVPFVELSNQPSSGVAVGKYVNGFALKGIEIDYAGAVGLYGSFKLTAKLDPWFYYVFPFLYGIIMGLFFFVVSFFKNPDLKFILYFFGCFFVFHSTMSGNLDVLLAKFYIKIILLFFYTFVIVIGRGLLKQKTFFSKY